MQDANFFHASPIIFSARRLAETLPGHRRYAIDYLSKFVSYVSLLGMRKFQVHTIPVMCGALGLFTF